MLQIRSIDKADLVEKDRSGVELRGSRIFEKEKKKIGNLTGKMDDASLVASSN